MDPREQIGDYTEAVSTALDGRQSKIQTCLPGLVQSFDPAEMTCSVQIALKGKQLKSDGSQIDISVPVLIHCPAVMPSGGGFTLTFYPEKNDECLMVFASRCVDAWWQNGGQQVQQEFRMHDMSDGFAILGVRSKPRVLNPAVKEHVTQLRSDDGGTYVEVDANNQITFKAPTKVIIDTPEAHFTGKITAVGEIDSQADVKAGTVSLQNHVHSGVQPGGGNSGPPVP